MKVGYFNGGPSHPASLRSVKPVVSPGGIGTRASWWQSRFVRFDLPLGSPPQRCAGSDRNLLQNRFDGSRLGLNHEEPFGIAGRERTHRKWRSSSLGCRPLLPPRSVHDRRGLLRRPSLVSPNLNQRNQGRETGELPRARYCRDASLPFLIDGGVDLRKCEVARRRRRG